MVNRIIFILTLLIALGLGAYFVYDMYEAIDQENRIERVEQLVIRKLMLVREAQEGHLKVHNKYADSWEALRTFIEEGEFPVIEVKETIYTLDYGADSVVIERDTIDFVPVIDSLYSAEDLIALDMDHIGFVYHPETENKLSPLELTLDSVPRANYFVQVIEVVDKKPYDKRRRDDSDFPSRRRLRFGSLTEISTAGNWE